MKITMSIQEAIDFKMQNPAAVIVISGYEAYVDFDADQPIIEITMNVAKKMLLNAGYLSAVDAAIANLGQDAKLDFEYAPFVHSDNPLVHAVLGGLGLSEEQIYQLFVDAESTFF